MYGLLGLCLFTVAFGAVNLRGAPPAGWPWGLGPRRFKDRWARDPGRAWHRHALINVVLGTAGTVAVAVGLLVR